MILPVFIAVRAVAGTAPCTPWVHTVGGFYEPNPANNLAAFSNLSLAAATEWCCNSQLCAGFSFVNETESGYYKGHPLSYYYVGAGFDGYAKPGEVPKPGPTPPPSPPPPPPPACIYPAGNSQECVDPYWKGTPPGVTAEYDCALRMHAWAFAQKTMPRRGSFKTVYDALQLQDCPSSRSPSNTTTANTTTTTTTDPPAVQDVYTPPTFPTPTDGTVIYVDAGAAAGGDGSKASPFASLELAVEGVAGAGAAAGATIVLRAGTYYTGGILLTHQHSGLTIQNYEGEDAAVSGAVQVPIKSADKWAVHSTATNTWRLDLSEWGNLPQEVFGMRYKTKSNTSNSSGGVGGGGSSSGATADVGIRAAVRARYPNGDPELGTGYAMDGLPWFERQHDAADTAVNYNAYPTDWPD
eukprot:gene26454-18651_t